MDLGPHAAFIIIAYAFSVAIVVGLIGWIMLDHRRQARILADLEARGITRRSERASSGKVEPGFPPGNATMPPP